MSRVAGNRNSREVAERGDEAGDRSARSGGETHRDLADAFVLWGQRRRYGLFLRLTGSSDDARIGTSMPRVAGSSRIRSAPGHR
jgi:hypothetical protein